MIGVRGTHPLRQRTHGPYHRSVVDRACQRWVLTLCLDDIFFHQVPIFMAVEPVSLTWVAAQQGPDRTGEIWAKVIERVLKSRGIERNTHFMEANCGR